MPLLEAFRETLPLPPAETVRQTLFWAFLTAHLLGDFLLQGPAVLEGRREGRPGAYLRHGLTHFVLLALFTWPAASSPLAWIWAIAAAVHVVIDVAKDRWQARAPRSGFAETWAFLADQALHVWALQTLIRWLPPEVLRPWRGAEVLLGVLTGGSLDPHTYLGRPDPWKTTAVFVAVILAGAVLVRLALEAWRALPLRTGFAPVPPEAPRTGLYIGMVERALVLVLLLLHAADAVGLVVAAKSIARFRDLEDRSFAEYYILGTLLSLVVALAGYLVLRPGG